MSITLLFNPEYYSIRLSCSAALTIATMDGKDVEGVTQFQGNDYFVQSSAVLVPYIAITDSKPDSWMDPKFFHLHLPFYRLRAKYRRYQQLALDNRKNLKAYLYMKKLVALDRILQPLENQLSLAQPPKSNVPKRAANEESLVKLGLSAETVDGIVNMLIWEYHYGVARYCQDHVTKYEYHRATCPCGSLRTCENAAVDRGERDSQGERPG